MRDIELAEALRVPITSLRRRMKSLEMSGAIDSPTRVATGVRNECFYELSPGATLTLLAKVEASERSLARKLAMDELYEFAGAQARVQHAQKLDELSRTHRIELEELQRKCVELTAETQRLLSEKQALIDLLGERWADNLMPSAESVFPERTCHASQTIGTARVCWNDTRIYLRVARGPEHYQKRVSFDWAEGLPFEEGLNHDFEGLRGLDLKTRLPVVYFNSESDRATIVVGFQLPVSEDWTDDDTRANAEFIARSVARKIL